MVLRRSKKISHLRILSFSRAFPELLRDSPCSRSCSHKIWTWDVLVERKRTSRKRCQRTVLTNTQFLCHHFSQHMLERILEYRKVKQCASRTFVSSLTGGSSNRAFSRGRFFSCSSIRVSLMMLSLSTLQHSQLGVFLWYNTRFDLTPITNNPVPLMTVYLQLTNAIKGWTVRQKLVSVSSSNRILFEILGVYSSVAITRSCVGWRSSSLSSRLFYLSSMKSHLHAVAVSIISRCC